MEQVFNVILPVFGAIASGYFFGWKGMLGRDGIKAMTGFVFNLAIPLLLFRAMVMRDFSEVKNFDLVYAYFGPVVLHYFLSFFLWGRYLGLSLQERSMFAMSSIYSNLVLIGLPLILLAYGEEGLAFGTLILIFHPTILLTMSTLGMEISLIGQKTRGSHAQPTSLWQRHFSAITLILKKSLWGVVRNPVLVSILLGLFANAISLPIPAVFDTFAELMGRAAVPCALFSVGASLVQYRIRGDIGQALLLTALKLIIVPASVWACCHYIFALGPLETATATLIAGMPLGVTVYLFSVQYDVYQKRASTVILLSSLGSAITLSTLLIILPVS